MKRTSVPPRLLLALCFALPLGLSSTQQAEAAWTPGGSGFSSALAYTMPPGAQPSASASGSTVTLSWPTAFFPGSQAVAGYIIRRFDAATGSEATLGPNCSGTLTTTTCTETNVPSGSWTYTDSTVQGGWNGAQSAPSPVVTVP